MDKDGRIWPVLQRNVQLWQKSNIGETWFPENRLSGQRVNSDFVQYLTGKLEEAKSLKICFPLRRCYVEQLQNEHGIHTIWSMVLYMWANCEVWIEYDFYLSTLCTVVNLVSVTTVHVRKDMVVFDPTKKNQKWRMGRQQSTNEGASDGWTEKMTTSKPLCTESLQNYK